MSQPISETRRLQYLLTSLIVILILILAVVFIFLAYPGFLGAEASPTQPQPSDLADESTRTPSPTITLTPTPSRTLRPTPTPTITLTPTITPIPSVTPTPAGPATLTPASPVLGDPYQLVQWSPDHADSMIKLIEDYPNTLAVESRGENNELYYDAFSYAITAQREGLLRYPDSPLADGWRWGLAYNLARVGDPGAGDLYGNIIKDALNRGDVDIANLSDWFRQREPRLALYVIELEPIPGFLRSYLLDLRGHGSAYIVLLETSSAYRSYTLKDAFDFINSPETRSVISDLSGDGYQEAGIYTIEPTKPYLVERPSIDNLSKVPPLELEYQPSQAPLEVGIHYENNWEVTRAEGGEIQLSFISRFFPACPVELRVDYQWGGEYFELVDTQFTFTPNPDTLSYCEFLSEHAAATWGYEPAIQLMEMLLPAWPPEEDNDGKPYPPDAIDEWRYRLGVYHAQLGDEAGAIEYFTAVLSDPGDPDGRWVSQASDFLAAYKEPVDVYRACVSVPDCNADHAMDYLINVYTREADVNIVEFLWDSGVILRASGYFDFDQDGFRERWITVQHRPLEVLSFWILAKTGNEDTGLFVSQVESSKPDLELLPDAEPPIVAVDGSLHIRLERDPETTVPYLTYPIVKTEFPNPFGDGLTAASEALFSGTDPDEVIDMLLALQESPGLRCELTWTCDPYYYLLGLAYELAGEERLAIETYLFLWWNYSKSPYTTMARLKLMGTITVTPTIISTPTTPTPTSILPYPTPTTGIPYPYPSPTSIIPYPFVTPTPINPYP